MISKTAFTLVELIVVMTIVSILSTVGFFSYISYISDARDTKRVHDLALLSEALNIHGVRNQLPLPSNMTTITSSGKILRYQGYFGETEQQQIRYFGNVQDPKDRVFYSYYLDTQRTKFQLLSFLEAPDRLGTQQVQLYPIFPLQLSAFDYEERFPKVSGKKLGILLEHQTHTPIQEISSGEYDILEGDIVLDVYFTDVSKITGTGVLIEEVLSSTP